MLLYAHTHTRAENKCNELKQPAKWTFVDVNRETKRKKNKFKKRNKTKNARTRRWHTHKQRKQDNTERIKVKIIFVFYWYFYTLFTHLIYLRFRVFVISIKISLWMKTVQLEKCKRNEEIFFSVRVQQSHQEWIHS